MVAPTTKFANETLRMAVKMWCSDRATAIAQHGPIGEWDTSGVTDMSRLFRDKYFNDDISGWNVSKVTNMRWMFGDAAAFNQPLEKWGVSSVFDMAYMFHGARAFNQPLDKWDVSNVKSMRHMFMRATAFNQPLDKWDVSNVKDMTQMFLNAQGFSQPKFLRRCVRPCTHTHANESPRTRVHMDRFGTNLCRVAHSGSAASLPLAAISTLMHVAAGGVGKAEPANRGAAEGAVRASRPAHNGLEAGAGGAAAHRGAHRRPIGGVISCTHPIARGHS